MPIYEFYCADCHTVFSFFGPTAASSSASPACPRCQRPHLERRPSRFATLKRRDDASADPMATEGDPFAGLDEARLEKAMEALTSSMEGADEDDPRAIGRMMRQFGSLTGLELGDDGEALVRRLESGEDPDTIEQEMEALEGDGDLDAFFRLKKTLGRRRPPSVDEELYFL